MASQRFGLTPEAALEPLTTMLDLDAPQLNPEYKAFLEDWAKALGVPVEVLIVRILVAAIDGHRYVEKIPDYHPAVEP